MCMWLYVCVCLCTLSTHTYKYLLFQYNVCVSDSATSSRCSYEILSKGCSMAWAAGHVVVTSLKNMPCTRKNIKQQWFILVKVICIHIFICNIYIYTFLSLSLSLRRVLITVLLILRLKPNCTKLGQLDDVTWVKSSEVQRWRRKWRVFDSHQMSSNVIQNTIPLGDFAMDQGIGHNRRVTRNGANPLNTLVL